MVMFLGLSLLTSSLAAKKKFLTRMKLSEIMSSAQAIPGYQEILKLVLKSQIQVLTEQLQEHTGEETLVLVASVTGGMLSHLGTDTGQGFLNGREEIKSQFLTHCLKGKCQQPCSSKQCQFLQNDSFQQPSSSAVLQNVIFTSDSQSEMEKMHLIDSSSVKSPLTSNSGFQGETATPHAQISTPYNISSPLGTNGVSILNLQTFLVSNNAGYNQAQHSNRPLVLNARNNVIVENPALPIFPNQNCNKSLVLDARTIESNKIVESVINLEGSRSLLVDHRSMNDAHKLAVCELKEKDKTKKTLSSKIDEITERIKKDETHKQQAFQNSIATEYTSMFASPDVTSESKMCADTDATVYQPENISEKLTEVESPKLKDTSRASHRKPKLPRYNIGVASDDEDNTEIAGIRVTTPVAVQAGGAFTAEHNGNHVHHSISSLNAQPIESDVLDIQVSMDDGDSSFAHFALDALTEGVLLPENITDIPIVEYNPGDGMKSVIENMFSLKPKKKLPLNSQSVIVCGANGEKRLIKCRMCPEKFQNVEALEDHLENVIHSHKKFQCDLCGRKFGQQRDMERHRRIHTGEKPFACEICNKSFARKDNLKSHRAKHFKKQITVKNCV